MIFFRYTEKFWCVKRQIVSHTPQKEKKMNQKIIDWCRLLASDEEKINHIKIELGERGNSTQIGLIQFHHESEDLARELERISIDAGWNADQPKIRFYAISVDGKTHRTKQITLSTSIKKNTDISDVHALMLENRRGQDALLNCIVEQARIQSSSLETLSESLAHREFALATVLETLIEAERENAETSAANMILEHHLSSETPQQENPYQNAAAKVLDGLDKSFVTHMEEENTTMPTEEQLKQWYENDVFFASSVDRLQHQSQNTDEKKAPDHPIPDENK